MGANVSELKEQIQEDRRESETRQMHLRREIEGLKQQARQEKELAEKQGRDKELKYQAELEKKERIFKEEQQRIIKEEQQRIFKEEQQRKEKEEEDKKQAALHKVLDKPWRRFARNGEWTEKYRKELEENIKNHNSYGAVKSARVVFIGPVRAGKSSFINSIASIDKGRISAPMLAGSASKTMTKKMKQYKPKKILQNFRLLDTMGIEESDEAGFNVEEIVYIIKGNLKPDHKFSTEPIDVNTLKLKPKLEDGAHCVAVVVDSSVLHSESISESAKKKIKKLQEHVVEHEVPVVVILTKIDELCELVDNDITAVYTSRKVCDVVDMAADLFGAPKANIFPVQSYSEEGELIDNQSILILLALEKMMHLANDRLECIDDQNDSE